MSKNYVLRKCKSIKRCNVCDANIGSGEIYYSSPYRSMCEKCYDVTAASANTGTMTNDSYVINHTCKYCDNKSIGMIHGDSICTEHINKALMEHT